MDMKNYIDKTGETVTVIAVAISPPIFLGLQFLLGADIPSMLMWSAFGWFAGAIIIGTVNVFLIAGDGRG